MRYTMVAATDIGCARSLNEDSIGTLPEHGIAAVADGLGGHPAGEIASDLAIRTFIDHFKTHWVPANAADRQSEICMQDAIDAANTAVYTAGVENPEQYNMGTTLVAICINDAHITIGHVGDSRCYRFRQQELIPMTIDHTPAGRIRHKNPYAQISYGDLYLEQTIGIQSGCDPDIVTESVMPGDRFLLCSDGLLVLEDKEITNVLNQQPDSPKNCVDALIKASLDREAPDNVSVILIQFH